MSTVSEVQVTPIEVIKSANDKRFYRHIRLPNAMDCLLVSDPEAEKSAACCDVHVGSLSDPPEAKGLAHFLEHMLFMGTEKYPEENAYSAYLSSHGGYSNAYTSLENTVYYFDVQNNHFEGALDLFATFFTCPLFAESSTLREINAVDSENSKNLQNDSWRKLQLFKSLARSDHPLNSFSTGNLSTLHTVPLEKGLNIRDIMIDFYKKYYSANLMKLTVYGKESLDTLQAWVTEKFSAVPNKNITRYIVPTNPFTANETKKIVEVVPVKDLKSIDIFFPIPTVEKHYESKPTKYLAHLIGHESGGSILSALKQKNWANNLSAYHYQSTADFAFLVVNIEISEEGFQHRYEVIDSVFAYIGMLHTQLPQDWIYQELVDISNLNFQFLDKTDAFDYAVKLANNMQHYQPQHIISGEYLIHQMNTSLVLEFLQYLTPDNALYFIQHKAFGENIPKDVLQYETWYQTPYNLRDVTSEQLEQWKTAMAGKSEIWSSSSGLLALPEPNPFVPTDFSLFSKDSADAATYPSLLSKEGQTELTLPEPVTAPASSPAAAAGDEEADEGEEEEEGDDEESDTGATGSSDGVIMDDMLGVSTVFWHKPDTTWKVPKAKVFVQLQNQFGIASVWNAVMLDLLVDMINEILNEYTYYASCSGLYQQTRLSLFGIEIQFEGYNHKLPVLVERVCQEIYNLAHPTEAIAQAKQYEQIFKRILERKIRSYKNNFVSQSYSHALTGAILCLEDKRYSLKEKYAVIQSQITSLSELYCFTKVFLQQLKVTVFIHGNYQQETIYRDLIQQKIQTILKYQHLPYGQEILPRAINLFKYASASSVSTVSGSDRVEFVYRQSTLVFNKDELNSAIENTYLLGTIATADAAKQSSTVTRDSNGMIDFQQDQILLEAMSDLLKHMMSEAAFDQLRTKEQLGYIVFTSLKKIAHNVLSFRVIVQSSHKDPIYLDERIESFLSQYYETDLLPMTEEKLAHFIDSFKEKMLEKPKNLDEEADRYWNEIFVSSNLFNREQLLVEKVGSYQITLKDIVHFYETYVLPPTFKPSAESAATASVRAKSVRTKFSSQLFGKNFAMPKLDENAITAAKKEGNVVFIKDPSLFKRKLELLPRFGDEL